jgi:hypothetical protein
MYDKVIAYPSGKVEYYYSDKIVTTGKDGIPRIRIRLHNRCLGDRDFRVTLLHAGHTPSHKTHC